MPQGLYQVERAATFRYATLNAFAADPCESTALACELSVWMPSRRKVGDGRHLTMAASRL